MEKIVIIGAGHGGVETAAALRRNGFQGTIDLVSDEAVLPYQRPPLSKDYIKRPGNPQMLKPVAFYADNAITLRQGSRATEINRSARLVALDDGSCLSYDHLVLATGARNRRPPIGGLDHPAVFELRTLADAERVVASIKGWQRVAIIGGGFIGLEAAGLLSGLGVAVDLVEMAPRLMQRAVSPIASQWFQDFHRTRGVRLHIGAQVEALAHAAGEVQVHISNGKNLAVNAVILASGVVPNVELASHAGLRVENGILVDESLLTDDPAISAIGDCATYPSIHLPGLARLESLQNAVDHARAVAGRLTGKPAAYDSLPWFWSIQGEARLQIAGLGRPGLTEVVRGQPDRGTFSVFLFDGQRLVCVESVNAASDHVAARRILSDRIDIPANLLADPAFELKRLLKTA